MANNVAVTPGTGVTFKTTDSAGVHTPHHNVDSLPASTNTIEVVGDAAHDATTAGNPLSIGGTASAAAPTSVSADGDAVRTWHLRNGAVATVVTAAGALVGGDAANGLDVDVTRVTGTVTIAGAVTNAGTFATQVDGAALTALQLIDNPVAVDGAAAVTGLFQVGGTDGTNAQIMSLTSAGLVNVADGGGTLTVDGTVTINAIPAGANNIGDVDVLTLPALPAGTNNIGDVDVLSVVPGTAATSLGKAEDAAHTTGDVGVLALGVRRDADTSPVDTDGDYHAPIFDNAGNLKVNIKAGAGSGGTALADGTTFTPDSTSLTPIGGMMDDATPATVTEGDAAVCRITTNRALHVNLRDAAGAELAVGGGTQYDEDTVHVTADKLTMAGAVRRDTAASGNTTDGDRATLNVGATGRLWASATIDAALPAGTNNIGDVDVLTLPNVTLAAGTNTNEVVGDVAHDAAAAGNPLLIGGYASAAAPADVSADADVVRAWRLRNGASATVITAAGALVGGDATNGLDVDVTRLPALPAGTNNIGDVDVLTVIPGTSATSLGKAEDAAHGSGDTGVMALAVRRDADTSECTTTADYAPLLVDEIGALKVRGRLSATIAPTMGTQTSGAYAANDFVDGKLTLANAVPIAAGSGLIHRVSVLSKSTQTAQYDVIFFNADPTATTITDNGAVQVNVADLTKVIGVSKCNDVISFGTGSLHQATALALSFKLSSGTTIYAAVVARSAITQTSTSDLILLVNIIPD